MNFKPISWRIREPRSVCATPDPARLERRGFGWIALSFLLCPCHLPLTLGLVATLLSGTALGAILHRSPWLAGSVITLVWALGTLYGVRHLRQASRYARGVKRALDERKTYTHPVQPSVIEGMGEASSVRPVVHPVQL